MSISPSEAEAIARQHIEENQGLQLGSLLFAYGFDALLMGCALAGFLRWVGSPRSKDDKPLIKATLILAFITALTETCLTWWVTINDFAIHYGTFIQFFDFNHLYYFAVLDVITVSAVKTFFADRAYRISGKSKVVVGLIAFFQCASFAAAVGVTALGHNHTLLDSVPGLVACLYLWPAGCLVADLVMASTILDNLRRNRQDQPGVKRMMTRLMIVTIEGQVGGIAIAIAFIICFSLMPHGFAPVFFLFWFPKVYLLGALTVLNSRDWWQRKKTSSLEEGLARQPSNSSPTEDTHELKTPTLSQPNANNSTASGQFGNLMILPHHQQHPLEELERKASIATFGPGASGQMESNMLGTGDYDSDLDVSLYSRE